MRYWIFQGNPKVFDINSYLTRSNRINWLVRQKHFQDMIAIGDIVYIWRADGKKSGSGGIVARGEITVPPRIIADDATALWRDGMITQEEELRVEVCLEEVRLNIESGMITRTSLLGNDILQHLLIHRMRALTNYEVSISQAKEIDRLWNLAESSVSRKRVKVPNL